MKKKPKKLDAKFYGQVALVGLGVFGLGKLLLRENISTAAGAGLAAVGTAAIYPKMSSDYKKHGTVFRPYIEL